MDKIFFRFFCIFALFTLVFHLILTVIKSRDLRLYLGNGEGEGEEGEDRPNKELELSAPTINSQSCYNRQII